jgi:hypothetical protein
VHNGGSSSILINFCPFCGAQLPESKRDLWFKKLETLGISEPSKANLPKKFRTEE